MTHGMFYAQSSVQLHLTVKNSENIVIPNIGVSRSNSCGRISIISNDLLVFQILSLSSCEITDKTHIWVRGGWM